MPQTKGKKQNEGRYGRYKARGAYRLVSRKTPGGRTVIQYKKRKPKNAKCGMCGAVLPGTPRERPHKMKNMAKTKKTPSRPYGGNLCSKCSRKKIIAEAKNDRKV